MAEKTEHAWDPRIDLKYQALVEDIRSIVRHWLRRHPEISRYKLAMDAGVCPQTIARLVETEVSKQSMAPLLRTLFYVLVAIDHHLQVRSAEEVATWMKHHPGKRIRRRGNTDYDVFLGEVCQAIWCWMGLKLHSDHRAAKAAGVSPKTVAKLLHEPHATRSPRLTTVQRLFAAAGASIWIEEGTRVRELGARQKRRAKPKKRTR